jgi:hypothetical protein
VPLVLYAFSQSTPLAVIAGGVLTALASAMAGATVGLLFGMPRAGAPAPAASSGAAIQQGIRPNTNLEDVSDWLTKIIVGVGLTQLGSIPGEFQRLVDFARGALSNAPDPGPVIGALIVTYAVTGFLLTYLFARTDLGAAVAAADASLVQSHAAAERLRYLSDLNKAGALPDDEYATKRKDVLRSI